MNTSRETRIGWFVSIGAHALALLLFLVISIPEIIQNQEFIEVTWGSPSRVTRIDEPREGGEASATEASRTAPSEKRATVKRPSQPVFLPERRTSDPREEPLPFRKVDKLDVVEQRTTRQQERTGGVGERESAPGRALGDRDKAGTTPASAAVSGRAMEGSGGLGGDVEKGVAFSIQWTEGGTRRKISGELPKYPRGVNVEAQIKILAVVVPDGSVKSAQPAQKANTTLEEAAMKEVRFWKFEPLRPSQPQNEQSCIVTFLFTLK